MVSILPSIAAPRYYSDKLLVNWYSPDQTDVERLVDLYNNDLAEGLDSLMTILPEEDYHKSVEPFCLKLSAIDKLTEEPAKRDPSYLVDMARVEALDIIGEKRKAVELLDRHV